MEVLGCTEPLPQQHPFHVVEFKSSTADVFATFLHDRGRSCLFDVFKCMSSLLSQSSCRVTAALQGLQ